MKLREFGEFKEIPRYIDYKELRKFIEESWSNRYTLYDDSLLDSDDETYKGKQRFFTFDGNKIKANNYIGFLSYEGLDITVYPKVFDKSIELKDIDKYLSINLLYWLSYSDRIKIPFINTDMDLSNIDDFLEILIYIFSKYTCELIYNKPYNTYEEVEEELDFLKGRLNTSSYIKENLGTGRWHKFNCTHDPFKYNNKFNKIIKFVSNMLLNISNNKDNIYYLQKINFILDEVDDIVCSIYDCKDVILSRLNEEYRVILNFCEMFLSSTSMLKSNGNDNFNFCFLIPMEILYEDFVFNFIKRNLKDKYKEIKKQKSNLFLADLYVNNEFSHRAFNLKQDIFLKDYNSKTFIIDTKYKVLSNDYPKFGVSQGDMYQMASYAFRGGYVNLFLVYPKVDSFYDEIKYFVRSPFMNEKISISIKFVSFTLDYSSFKEGNSTRDIYRYNDELIYTELLKL